MQKIDPKTVLNSQIEWLNIKSTMEFLDAIDRTDSEHEIHVLDIMYEMGNIRDDDIRTFISNETSIYNCRFHKWMFDKIITFLTEDELIKILDICAMSFHSQIIFPNQEYRDIIKSLPIDKLNTNCIFIYHPEVFEEYTSNLTIRQLIYCLHCMNFNCKDISNQSLEILVKTITERIKEEEDISWIFHVLSLTGLCDDIIDWIEELLDDSNKYYFASLLLSGRAKILYEDRSYGVELDNECRLKMFRLFESKYGHSLDDHTDQLLYFCYMYHNVSYSLHSDVVQNENGKIIEFVAYIYRWNTSGSNCHTKCPQLADFRNKFKKLFGSIDFNNLSDLSDRAENMIKLLDEFNTFIKSD